MANESTLKGESRFNTIKTDSPVNINFKLEDKPNYVANALATLKYTSNDLNNDLLKDKTIESLRNSFYFNTPYITSKRVLINKALSDKYKQASQNILQTNLQNSSNGVANALLNLERYSKANELNAQGETLVDLLLLNTLDKAELVQEENKKQIHAAGIDQTTRLAALNKAIKDTEISRLSQKLLDFNNLISGEELKILNLQKVNSNKINQFKYKEALYKAKQDYSNKLILLQLTYKKQNISNPNYDISEDLNYQNAKLLLDKEYSDNVMKIESILSNNTFEPLKNPNYEYTMQPWVTSKKKGGSMNKQLDEVNSFLKYIEESNKNYSKRADNFSKVTYKAIIKALGLK